MPKTDDTLTHIANLVGIPDGSLPTTAVAVIGYLDTEGVGRYGIAANENADCSHLVGLLHMAAHQITHEISYNEDD